MWPALGVSKGNRSSSNQFSREADVNPSDIPFIGMKIRQNSYFPHIESSWQLRPFPHYLPFTPLVLTFSPRRSGTLICDFEEPSPPDSPPFFLSLLDRIHRRFSRPPLPPRLLTFPCFFLFLRFPRFHPGAFLPLLLCSPLRTPCYLVLQSHWRVALFQSFHFAA